MVDRCFRAARADRAFAAATSALVVEFPDLDYVERCIRLWSERHDLAIGVWRPSPGTPPAAAEWQAAAEHAQWPDALALVLVPDGHFAEARRDAATALPETRWDDFVWMPAADLFLTDTDIVQCQGDQETSPPPQEIRARVGGWPELVPVETGSVSTRGGIDSAVRLVLDSASLSSRRTRFLQYCAVAEILTVDARDAIWPDPDRDELTHWAIDRGWITRCDDPTLLGILPSRWRTVLMADLERGDPGATSRLSRHLHQLYFAHDVAPDIMLRQAKRTGDEHLIVQVLDTHLLQLSTSHGRATAATLATLTPARFTSHPSFALVRDMLGELLRPAGGPHRHRLHAPEKPSSIPLIAAARLMFSNRLSGHIHQAAQNAATLRRLVEQPSDDASWPVDYADFVLLHCGITSLLDGDFSQAEIDFEHAYEGWEKRPVFIQRDTLGKLALVRALQGELTTAEQMLQTASALPLIAKPFQERALVAERLAAALIAGERLDGARVREAWDNGWFKLTPGEELWPFVLFVGQRCASVMGADMLPLQLADGALRRTETGPDEYCSALTRTVRAESLIALGSLPEAEACLAQIPVQRTNQFSRLACVRLALRTDQYEQATRLGTSLSVEASSLAVRVESLFLCAAALWKLEQHSRAVQCVRSASIAAGAEGMRLPMLAVPTEVGAALFPASGIAARPPIPDGAGLRHGPGLTPALRSVLAALATTGSIREIGARLHLSQNTIKTHLRRLYRTLGVHTRDEALAEATRLGLLE